MATFNIADGTGGLDASIRFERDRPEVCYDTRMYVVNALLTLSLPQNVGDGFINTINTINVEANRYVSCKYISICTLDDAD